MDSNEGFGMLICSVFVAIIILVGFALVCVFNPTSALTGLAIIGIIVVAVIALILCLGVK